MLRKTFFIIAIILITFVTNGSARIIGRQKDVKKSKYLYDEKTDKHMKEVINKSQKLVSEGKVDEAIDLLTMEELTIRKRGLTIPKKLKPGQPAIPSPYVITLSAIRTENGEDPIELLDYYTGMMAYATRGSVGALYKSSNNKVEALEKISLFYDYDDIIEILPELRGKTLEELGVRKKEIDKTRMKVVPIIAKVASETGQINTEAYDSRIRPFLIRRLEKIGLEEHVNRYLKNKQDYDDFSEYCIKNNIDKIADSFLQLELAAFYTDSDMEIVFEPGVLLEMYPVLRSAIAKAYEGKLLKIYKESNYKEYVNCYKIYSELTDTIPGRIRMLNLFSLRFQGKECPSEEIGFLIGKEIIQEHMESLVDDYHIKIIYDSDNAGVLLKIIKEFNGHLLKSGDFQREMLTHLFQLDLDKNLELGKFIISNLDHESGGLQPNFISKIVPFIRSKRYSKADKLMTHFIEGLNGKETSYLKMLYGFVKVSKGEFALAKDIYSSIEINKGNGLAEFLLRNWNTHLPEENKSTKTCEVFSKNIESNVLYDISQDYLLTAYYRSKSFDDYIVGYFDKRFRNSLRQSIKEAKLYLGFWQSMYCGSDLPEEAKFWDAYLSLLDGDLDAFMKYVQINQKTTPFYARILNGNYESYLKFRKNVSGGDLGDIQRYITKLQNEGDVDMLRNVYLMCIIENVGVDVAHCYYNFGYIYLVSGEIDMAKEIFFETKGKFPKSQSASKSRKMLARIKVLTGA